MRKERRKERKKEFNESTQLKGKTLIILTETFCAWNQAMAIC